MLRRSKRQARCECRARQAADQKAIPTPYSTPTLYLLHDVILLLLMGGSYLLMKLTFISGKTSLSFASGSIVHDYSFTELALPTRSSLVKVSQSSSILSWLQCCIVSMAGSVSCLDWQRLTLILVSIIVDLSESSYVWYVKSPKPELGATEINCFVVALFVAGAIRALYQVYIDFYIQPTFSLPNSPKVPEKVGYKSKRHIYYPTRRMRRGYLCASSRDSAHSSW